VAASRQDINAARELRIQARRDAAFEHRALSFLISARKDAIEDYDATVLIENGPALRTYGARAYRESSGGSAWSPERDGCELRKVQSATGRGRAQVEDRR
jgi:hypothetical protein